MPCLCTCVCLQILALRLLQAVLPSWEKTERAQDMKFLVEKLFNFLGSLLSTCSSDLPLLRSASTHHSSVFTNCAVVCFKSLFKRPLHPPKQKVPCEGGSPAPRLRSRLLTAARWRRRSCASCALCTALASGMP